MIQQFREKLSNSLKILGISTILGMVLLQTANAGSPPIYDVEIIIFLNNKSQTGGESPGSAQIHHLADQSRSFPEGEFTELSYQFYQMKDITESLDQSSNYNVLFHRAWRQLAYNETNAIPYPLDSIVDSDNKSVAGSVRLVMERYLHLDVDVLLISSNNSSHSDSASDEYPVLRLKEKRRVKGSQIHYFDHPYLSVIAKVTPYRENGKNNDTANSSFLRQKLAIK